MWLLIDIGNSSSKAGLYDPTSGSESVPGEMVATKRFEHQDHLESALNDFLRGASFARVGAVSVVPAQSRVWEDECRRLLDCQVEFYDESSNLPFDLTYRTPSTMGNDRIAAAAAGWRRHAVQGHLGVIVIDVGTAINYEVVTKDGVYPGGVIAGGPGLIRSALRTGTAQLPEVSLAENVCAIGRTTDEAIRSGVMHGVLDSITGMVARIQNEMASECEVVLTGGWGQRVQEALDNGWHFAPDLVLMGISDLMRLAD